MTSEACGIQKSVIVLSTGRTGTDFLARFFATNFPGVKAVQEEFGGRRIRLLSNRYLSGRLSRDELIRKLKKRYGPRLADVREPLFFEANPYLSGCLDVLTDVFCEPLIVHIVRDPRTYAQSHINFGAFHGLKRVAGYLIPSWSLKPEHYDPGSQFKWSKMPAHLRMAWRWKVINEHLDRGLSLYPGRYHRLAFEDLFVGEATGLKQLVELCDLPWKPNFRDSLGTRANASRRKSFPHWRDWSDEMAQDVHCVCGELMNRYGYGREPEWGVKLSSSERPAA